MVGGVTGRRMARAKTKRRNVAAKGGNGQNAPAPTQYLQEEGLTVRGKPKEKSNVIFQHVKV